MRIPKVFACIFSRLTFLCYSIYGQVLQTDRKRIRVTEFNSELWGISSVVLQMRRLKAPTDVRVETNFITLVCHRLIITSLLPALLSTCKIKTRGRWAGICNTCLIHLRCRRAIISARRRRRCASPLLTQCSHQTLQQCSSGRIH